MEELEIWPDKVCLVPDGKCYHRAAYQMFSHAWGKNRGFVRSVCGVIDSHEFSMFWHFYETDEKFLKWARDHHLVACKRCFPEKEEKRNEIR